MPAHGLKRENGDARGHQAEILRPRAPQCQGRVPIPS